MGHGFAWGDVRASVCRTRICYRRISCTCATAAGALSPPTRRDFYPGTVTLFRVREPHPLSCDPLRLWPAAAAKVEVCHVPGTHVTFIEEPNVQVLGEQMGRRL